jgi:hypothetical protein
MGGDMAPTCVPRGQTAESLNIGHFVWTHDMQNAVYFEQATARYVRAMCYVSTSATCEEEDFLDVNITK